MLLQLRARPSQRQPSSRKCRSPDMLCGKPRVRLQNKKIIVMCQTGGTLETTEQRKARNPRLPAPIYGTRRGLSAGLGRARANRLSEL